MRKLSVPLAWRLTAGLTGMLLAFPLVTGCASPSHGSSSVAPLSGIEVAVLTNSGDTARADAQVKDAVEILTERCMRAEGLIYYPELQATAAVTMSSIPEIPPYRSLADRQANGYGAYAVALREAQSGHGTASPPTAQEQLYVNSLSHSASARYWVAWIGSDKTAIPVNLPGGGVTDVPSGGCRGKVVRSIYGSIANWIQATNGAQLITNHLSMLVESSPRFVAALHKWSRCMAGHRYKYANPWDAWNWFADQYAKHGPTSSLHKLEISVAVTDYQCAQAVSLLRVTKALQKAAAEHLGPTLVGDLARIVDIDIRAQRAAQKLVPGA